MLRPALPPAQRSTIPPAIGMLGNGSMADPNSIYQVQMNQVMNQAGGNLQHRPQQMPVRGGPPNMQNMANVGVGMNQHMLAQGMPFVGHSQQQPIRRVPSNQPGPHFNQQIGMPMNSGNPNLPNMGFRPHPGQHMNTQIPRNVGAMQTMTPEMQMQMRQGGGPPTNQGPGMGGGMGMGLPANMAGMQNNRPPQQLMGGIGPPSMGPHLTNGMNPNFNPVQPPQMTSSPRPGSSHMQNQPSISRARMTPDQQHQQNLFQNGQQFPGGTRIPPSNAQFPFVPSAGSPNPLVNTQGDVSHQLGPPFNPAGGSGAPGNAPGGPGRMQPGRVDNAGFHVTPAQQFEQMANGENFSSGSFPPQRPPSQHHTPHTQHNTPQMQTSSPHPHSSPQQHPQQRIHTPSNSHMHPPPQRPQSQGRPSSQAGHRTPNPNHSTSNPMTPQGMQSNPMVPPGGRISRQQQHPSTNQIPPGAAPAQTLVQQAIPPNQPLVPVQQGPPRPPMTSGQPPNGSENNQMMRTPAIPTIIHPPVGSGQGLLRLLQFSGILSAQDNFQKKLQLSWWKELIKDYFAPKAIMKFTLWKDNSRQEAKPFEIGTAILPRFFLVTAQSGVKSMSLSLDGARERLFTTGHSVIECVTAVWTYKYTNGYTVTLRGPLTVHVIVSVPTPSNSGSPGSNGRGSPPSALLRFEDFQFDALIHDKYIAVEHIEGIENTMNGPMPEVGPPVQNGQNQNTDRSDEQRVPVERGSVPLGPVNAFGIPQATMRCLELAESVGQMADLISFTTDTGLGPMDALKQFAQNLRDKGLAPPPQTLHTTPFVNGGPHSQHPYPPPPFTQMVTNVGPPQGPVSTHYPNVIPSSNPLPGSTNSPQASTSGGNSPQKQHKTIPQQQPMNGASSSSATTPGVSTTGGNTPSMANATLKRKQGSETASPTTAHADQPPLKRQGRKRKATQS
ncbi:hypothetical protein EYR38_005155 [Pleurotus pulmonarius]|nr:hypothetical protein EYR38_005155 [Pleurotus pulmonarius]